MRCANPTCGRKIPLLTSRWLANSTRRTVWIEFHVLPQEVAIRVQAGDNASADPNEGTMKASSATLPRRAEPA